MKKTLGIERVGLTRAMHPIFLCLRNSSSELSLLSFIKIGTPPAYTKRRLFVQISNDNSKVTHEYYINTITNLDLSEGDITI